VNRTTTLLSQRLASLLVLIAAWFLVAGIFVLRAPRALAYPPADELLLTLDPDKSEFHWTLDSTLHTVHGTFKFKRGELRLNPTSGTARGEILVSATSADSGNEGRDKKMHKDVLESAQFQEILFTADRVEGKVAASGPCSVLLHGTMKLHGADHEFGAPVEAEITADHWKATSKFVIPFIKWGLKNPSTWILKVKPDVNVELTMTGTLKAVTAQ
jgi:polyisoprenoid-binding protein YceI